VGLADAPREAGKGNNVDATIAPSTTIHIFVEFGQNNPKEVVFHTNRVTGLEIKQKAGVPAEDALARREGQRLVPVSDDETLIITEGEHFVVVPPGTVS
jgi:hypothetical protein